MGNSMVEAITICDRTLLLARHASHALDRGAPLSLVAGTLGHANVATTSVYLHAKPGTSSGDQLDPKVWEAK